jgi:putative transcriptional regulator
MSSSTKYLAAPVIWLRPSNLESQTGIVENLEYLLHHWLTSAKDISMNKIAKLRKRVGLSQTVFARTFGFHVAALRNWEHGRRRPSSAARALLKIIEYAPDIAARALARRP